MQLRFFGGLVVDDGARVVPGRGQQALLLRLAVDAGTTVGYRPLAEDVWSLDRPDDPRAALQSLVSRLRRALPHGVLESAPGGYRLALDRADVDITRFQDLVAAARIAADAAEATRLAREALDLWTGDPWVPGDGFDWIVRDLLEDRAHAERLADARVAGGPVASPPASAPAPLTALVGRHDELQLIAEQLVAERLVTLIGPGGAGKTTLALETVRHRPGSVVVELAPASAGEVWSAVAGAVARSIRLDAAATPSTARDRAVEALAGRSVLIVLDNCEHVAPEAGAVVRDLLGSVPGARVLTTSREPLGVLGEAFVVLGPLPERDAAELFARRVRAARGAEPRADETATVERIVRRLDGLPLALELAAAKARTLTLAEIDAGLDDRFTLLERGPRAADPRHQTLRALIDWSWETLTEPERTALLAASVFPDGIGVDDAPTVAQHLGTDAEAFDLLVDRSLVRRHDGRFRLLETVREYGLDRLRRDGRSERFLAAQAQVMAEIALGHDAVLRGRRVRTGLAWFDANEENLSAALRAVLGRADLHETGVRLVRGAIWAWFMRERFDELQAGITRFAGEDAALDSEAAVLVQGLGLMAEAVRTTIAADAGGAPLDLRVFTERARGISDAASRHPSELTTALPVLLDGIARALAGRSAGAPWTRGFSIADLPAGAPEWTQALIALLRSAIAQNSGDVLTLGRESERALAGFQELGDVWGTAFASQMRAEWLLLRGRLEEALAVTDASTAGLTGLTSVSDVVQQRTQGITALVRLGRLDEARARLVEIMAVADTDGSERARVQAALAAASVEFAAGDGEAVLAVLDATPLEAGAAPEQIIAWSATMRARGHLLRGRIDHARDALRDALSAALRSGDQPILADSALTLAWWLLASDDDAAARRALSASIGVRGAVDATDPTYRRLREELGGAEEAASEDGSSEAAVAELEKLARLLG